MNCPNCGLPLANGTVQCPRCGIAISAPKNSPAWIWIGGIGIATFCLCPMVLGAILFPVFQKAKEAAKQTAVLSDAKQGVTSELILMVDTDGKIPAFQSANEAKKALEPYMRRARSSSLPIQFPRDYVWNPELFNHYQDAVSDPANIWIFHSTSKINNKTAVAFLNGKCKMETDDALAQTLAVHPVIDPNLDKPRVEATNPKPLKYPKKSPTAP